jgi:hypothetical protein
VIASDPAGNSTGAVIASGQDGQDGQDSQDGQAGHSEAAESVRAGEPTPTPSQPRENTRMLETS